MPYAAVMIANPNLQYEEELWKSYQYITGLDEAGRGALAGPVCVGAVILPRNEPALLQTLSGVRDSKQLTPRKRFGLVEQIKTTALAWGIGFASAEDIDSIGIVPATRLAALLALDMLSIFPEYLLTDFRLELPELGISQTSLIKGDQRSLSIASASIIAKTARDELMMQMDRDFPGYGLSQHKGYGTSKHIKQIATIGYSPIHRKTFKIKNSAG